MDFILCDVDERNTLIVPYRLAGKSTEHEE